MRKPLLLVLGIVVLGLSPVWAQETRSFVDDQGHEVEIPVDPQRIVSLRGEQTTAPLVELGANLVGSTGRIIEGVNNGLPHVRGAYDALDYRMEEHGVGWVGHPTEPDMEAIAALEPDLIIATDVWQANYDHLAIIAPTVIFNVWEQDMLELYRKVADVSGRLDVYEEMLRNYDARIERGISLLSDTIGDPKDVSIAIASAYPADGQILIHRNYGTLSQVLRDLGFTMPDVIAQLEDGNSTISVERIEEIDADFMIDTYVSSSQPPSFMIENWDEELPIWRDVLHAAGHNQFFMVNREEMRAVSFQALRSMTEIVLANIATRDFVPLER
ncbi:ABC transporter substrate-binding protein [Pelagibacterium lentulum]|uniref:Protein translocase component YidC n=1 Tax=Pelagibacterium lentulum TaxID=2029865 RepID=A0A916R8Y9_9HYPH|nr:ABC transporter substrate-binding protein [Pelagibacterium lentulum]GGA42755.1 protein translocase component YidC [Pelagibacterium lentulum]